MGAVNDASQQDKQIRTYQSTTSEKSFGEVSTLGEVSMKVIRKKEKESEPGETLTEVSITSNVKTS